MFIIYFKIGLLAAELSSLDLLLDKKTRKLFEIRYIVNGSIE